MAPPDQITLSGSVYPAKPSIAIVGDVAIYPGAGQTPYIDASVSDGESWRALHLKSFGFDASGRRFFSPGEIGPIMREIESKIRRGMIVHYDFPFGSKKRKYIYRGLWAPALI